MSRGSHPQNRNESHIQLGSDLTITGAAAWIGGVLNSTANLASVIFDGGTVVIDGTADLETGSNLNFVDSKGSVVPTMAAPNSLTFGNGQGLYILGTGHVIIGSGGSTVVDGAVKVEGGTVAIMGSATLNSLYVLKGGTATIGSGGKTSFTGAVPGWDNSSVLVIGGKLNIQNGTTLDGGSKNVDVSGWDGGPSFSGELNTFASNHKSQTTATIMASKLRVGTGAGSVSVTIEKDSLAPGNHVYSTLEVKCDVD